MDFSKAFDPKFCTYDKPSRALLDDCLEVITNYMDRVEALAAMPQDDRESRDWSVQVLESALALPFPGLVRHHLKAALDPIHRTLGVDKLYERLVTCWARYVALVTDRKEKRADGNVRIHQIDTSFLLTSL